MAFIAHSIEQLASLSEAAVTPVGGTAAYIIRTATFTAAAPSALIEFTQTAAGDQTVLLDDIKVTGIVQDPLPCLGLAPTRLELSAGAQGQVNVTVPAQLLAFPPAGGVQVTMRSPNPLVARIPSGIDDVITLTWANGDPLTKSFLVEAVAPGAVQLEVLNSATLCVDRTVIMAVTTQLVRNPSFEIDAVPGGVGYGAIGAWDSNSALTGLNRAGMPFLDNGAVPDASQVAFIQGDAVLSQTIATMPMARANPSPVLWSTSPVIWRLIRRVTRLICPPVSWYAVAWAPNEFPNSRIIVPSRDGVRIGRAT